LKAEIEKLKAGGSGGASSGAEKELADMKAQMEALQKDKTASEKRLQEELSKC